MENTNQKDLNYTQSIDIINPPQKQVKQSQLTAHLIISYPHRIVQELTKIQINPINYLEQKLNRQLVNQQLHQKIQCLIKVLDEVEKVNKVKFVEIVLLIVRNVWEANEKLRNWQAFKDRNQDEQRNNLSIKRESEISKKGQSKQSQQSISKLQQPTINLTLQLIPHISLILSSILLAIQTILTQPYFTQLISTALFIPILKHMPSNTLFESLQSYITTISLTGKEESQKILRGENKSPRVSDNSYGSRQKESELLPRESVCHVENGGKTQIAKQESTQVRLMRLKWLINEIKSISGEFLVWMSINFYYYPYNTNIKTTSPFTLALEQITHHFQPKSNPSLNPSLKPHHDISTQSMLSKITASGFKHFTLNDKNIFSNKISTNQKQHLNLAPKQLISFFIEFWLEYFLLTLTLARTDNQHNGQELTDDALEIQLEMREYLFAQMVSTRDFLIIEVGLQALVQAFVGKSTIDTNSSGTNDNSYPTVYNIKPVVVLQMTLRLLISLLFTCQMQLIATINSKLLYNLFVSIFVNYRLSVKQKFQSINYEIEKQFIVLVNLLKVISKELRLQTLLHQKIQGKLCQVYTRYQLEETLDQFAYLWGRKQQETGSLSGVYEWKHLVSYLIQTKVLPLKVYNQEKFTYFVYNVEEQFVAQQIASIKIPKIQQTMSNYSRKIQNRLLQPQSKKNQEFQISYSDKGIQDSWEQPTKLSEIRQLSNVESNISSKSKVRSKVMEIKEKEEEQSKKFLINDSNEIKLDSVKQNQQFSKQSIKLTQSQKHNIKLTEPQKQTSTLNLQLPRQMLASKASSNGSIIKLNVPNSKGFPTQISFMPGHFPLNTIHQIPQSSKQYGSSQQHTKSLSSSGHQTQEQLLKQYKLKQKKNQIEKKIIQKLGYRLNYHEKIKMKLDQMQTERKVKEKAKINKDADFSDMKLLQESNSGSSYNNSKNSKWKAIMSKKSKNHQQNKITPVSSPNKQSFANSGSFSPHMIQTANFKLPANIPNHRIQSYMKSSVSQMKETAKFYNVKRSIENSRKQPTTIQGMKESYEKFKNELMKRSGKLVESKHETVRNNIIYEDMIPILESGQVEIDEPAYQSNLKQMKSGSDPDVRIQTMIKSAVKSSKNLSNNLKDNFFTPQEMLYLQNLKKASQKGKSPQKQKRIDDQTKKKLKNNMQQIIKKKVIEKEQNKDKQSDMKKRHKKYHLALESQISQQKC